MQTVRKDIHNSEVPVLCQSCEARHQGICGALNAQQLLALSKTTRRVRKDAGDELMADAMPIASFANVLRGVIKLTKVLEDGRQQVVGLQFAPDLLGRPFAAESRVSAEAASEVDLCVIPKPALESIMKESAPLEHRVMMQALRELDEARDWMVTLGRKSASEKVASFLYLIATHIDPTVEQPETSFDLPLSRADIADFLGLTIETVSRQISKLKADNVIEILNYRHVTVPDLARLRLRCG
ncbi:MULTISPECIES: Crp/Fnr family transcriptional regulator [Devosia]|uniref:Nitrogen fixation regulation protein FixK n=1 Tax=Devosia equisanguinis TaxID=2490941 RepID=A0A3S4GK10_9HYPH|nr:MULTISPECIES: Crp/Fnr family transcriptional regulator [Devosia]ODT47450.1 MAG: transcriptional regulator [Pelagibacterium sp. SCN 63-126]ODU87126.1 MAG: transcriptional regulator [Pelagibacterium sp. SCN 63-17]OJX42842.1 MAG: transcriptional regulator [Devosia sp. 63-57]VDS04751.1 Nitrogen fixation regulation protein FixK [Devosia equisanguinis]